MRNLAPDADRLHHSWTRPPKKGASMIVNRRSFLALLFQRRIEVTPVSVRVLEIFMRDQTPSAVLVHHADDASRDRFAQWLRANPKALVRVRDSSGNEAAATVFRVRMCFGRGLILLDGRIPVREGDVLMLVARF